MSNKVEVFRHIKAAMEKPYDMTTKIVLKQTGKSPSFTCHTSFFPRIKDEITLEWIFTWKSSGTIPCSQQEKLSHYYNFTHGCVQSSFEYLSSGWRSYLPKQQFCFQPS